MDEQAVRKWRRPIKAFVDLIKNEREKPTYLGFDLMNHGCLHGKQNADIDPGDKLVAQ